ncbi:MAG: hypothetical protein ACR2IV_06040 [Bryobacteraceae bacterium]
MIGPLVTYLEDHLAVAAYAIDLLGAIRDQHTDEPLGQFAVGMLVEVEADNGVLKELAEQIGTGSSGLKGLAAWAEKVSRLKLKRGASDGLGTFEALEFLALGIQGKLALWRALAVAGPADARLNHLDFDHLAARAETQHAQVEERRLEAARTVLRPVQE